MKTSLIDNINATIKRHLPSELLLSTTTEQVEVHGLNVEVLNVHYRAGNESLPLHAIIDDLRKLGKVIAEYRGREIERGIPQLAFEVTTDEGQCVAVHWFT